MQSGSRSIITCNIRDSCNLGLDSCTACDFREIEIYQMYSDYMHLFFCLFTNGKNCGRCRRRQPVIWLFAKIRHSSSSQKVYFYIYVYVLLQKVDGQILMQENSRQKCDYVSSPFCEVIFIWPSCHWQVVSHLVWEAKLHSAVFLETCDLWAFYSRPE